VPFNTNPPNPLLAIATDLLAQAEAQQRAAVRLEQSVRQHARLSTPLAAGARDRASAASPIEQIREQARAMRDLFDAERSLLDELEREIAGATK
jgi:hypothetical protein